MYSLCDNQKEVADMQACYLGGLVKRFVATYPNYLYKNKCFSDFIKFLNYLDLFMDDLFPGIIPSNRYAIRKGQAASLSVTEAFNNP